MWKLPRAAEFEIAYRVAKLAIEDAGIDKNEIGAVLRAAHIMGDKYNTEMVFGRMPEAIGAKGTNITCMTNSAAPQGQANLSPGQRAPGDWTHEAPRGIAAAVEENTP